MVPSDNASDPTPSRYCYWRPFPMILLIILLIWTAGTLVDMLRNPAMQWDLRAFYFASEAYQQGLDPYEPDNLSRISGYRIHHGFLYPPVTLVAFRLLTMLPYPNVFWVWPFLKLLAVLALLLLWRRQFQLRTPPPALLAVVLLGFNAALIWDLRSGSISVFEQLLLWSAFACFLQQRYSGFVVLLVLVALFKIVFIVFLGLLLLSRVSNPHPSAAAGSRIRLSCPTDRPAVRVAAGTMAWLQGSRTRPTSGSRESFIFGSVGLLW
jgi:hypothetical protein